MATKWQRYRWMMLVGGARRLLSDRTEILLHRQRGRSRTVSNGWWIGITRRWIIPRSNLSLHQLIEEQARRTPRADGPGLRTAEVDLRGTQPTRQPTGGSPEKSGGRARCPGRTFRRAFARIGDRDVRHPEGRSRLRADRCCVIPKSGLPSCSAMPKPSCW